MKILMVTSSYPKFPGDVTAPFVESIAMNAPPNSFGRTTRHRRLLGRSSGSVAKFARSRYAVSPAFTDTNGNGARVGAKSGGAFSAIVKFWKT